MEQDGKVVWKFGWFRPRYLEIGLDTAVWVEGRTRFEFPLKDVRMTRVWGLGVAEEGWELDSGTLGLILTDGTTLVLGDGISRRKLGETAKELSRDLRGRGPSMRT